MEKVQEIGYDYIELSGQEIMAMSDSEFQALVKHKNALDYTVMGFNAYCDERTPIVGDRYCAEKTKDYAEKICSRGASLGIRFLDIGAPAARKLPTGYDKKKADAQCEAFLTITAQVAKLYGIEVLFEAMHAQCCDYANYTMDALHMIKKLSIENLKINLDFYHMTIMKESFETLAVVMPYVRHLHYNHITTGSLAREFICPADKPILEQLKKIIVSCGYDGTFSIEPDDTPAFERLAPVSYQVMREVFN